MKYTFRKLLVGGTVLHETTYLHRLTAYLELQPPLSGVCRLSGGIRTTCAGWLSPATGSKLASNRRSASAGQDF